MFLFYGQELEVLAHFSQAFFISRYFYMNNKGTKADRGSAPMGLFLIQVAAALTARWAQLLYF